MTESLPDTAPSPSAGAPPQPPAQRPTFLRTAGAHLREMFALDTRSLALFRVVLAGLVLVDLFNRWPHIEAHYTDFGVLPRSTYIDNFLSSKWVLCLHMWGGTVLSQQLLFILQAAVTAVFLVGYRTRLFHFLSWLLLCSLHTRNPYVLQGGDVLLRQLFFWTIFLPMGAQWSVDRALSATESQNPAPKTVMSVVSFAYLMQVCMVYWYTAALKTGVEWRDGTAVWYALNIDHFSTPVATFLLQFPSLMSGLTHFTLWFEWGGPFLIFFPILPQLFRGLGVLGFVGLHAGFGLGLKIGLFVFVSCTSWLPMIPSAFWDRLGAFLDRRRPSEARIIYDGDCGFCRRVARLLHTGLLLRRTALVPSTDDPALDARVKSLNSWIFVDHQGVEHVEGAAIRAAFAASPAFFWLAPLLGLPGLRQLVQGLYSAIRARRAHFGRHPNLLRERAQTWRAPWIVQPLAGLLLLYVIMWNNGSLANHKVVVAGTPIETALPAKLSLLGGAVEINDVKALGYSLRLDQKWDMFAPRPMRGDGWFVVAGTTRKGKVVNLWGDSEQVIWEKPPVVSATYPGQRWRKYMMNLWMNNFKKHRRHYGRYLCRLFDRDRAETGDRLETLQIFYMKEETEPQGVAPIECRSLWQHWCTEAGKTTPVRPYADTCEQYNVRAAVEKAQRAACACPSTDDKCFTRARAKYADFEKRKQKTPVTVASIASEISTAEASYQQCLSKAPAASAVVSPPPVRGERPR